MSRATRARVCRPAGSTSCPWRPALVSKCPRGDPMSLANRVRVRVPTGSTSSPGPLGPVPKDPFVRSAVPGDSPDSEAPRARAALPDHSCLGPRARGVDQLSRRLGPWLEGPRCRPGVHGDSGPCPENPRVRPALPCDLCPGPRACGMNRLTRGIRARVRGPVVSTGCPRGIRPVPAGQQVLPVDPGDSVPCLRAQDVDQIFRALGPGCEVRRGRPTVPHDSGTGQKARMFKQLSRTTRAWVRWPAWSTSFLG